MTDPVTQQLNRSDAIEKIRRNLWSRVPEYECACVPTAPLGAFCGGFRRLDDAELRRRFGWLGANSPNLTRRQLEAMAGAHHASRQEALHAAVCCDVETRERCGCEGWETFDDATLERIVLELTGSPIRIRSASTPSPE